MAFLTRTPMGSIDVGSDADSGVPTAGAPLGDARRRSSTRSIKRKKFDDELVESSFVKCVRVRQSSDSAAPSAPPRHDLQSAGASELDAPAAPVAVSAPTVQTLAVAEKRRNKSSKSSRLKKSKAAAAAAAALGRGLGRWKAQDDLALILAVQQTCDLAAVHVGVKFSCRFTLREVRERWHALLYDAAVSKTALAAVRQLHPDIVTAIQSRALFSKEEERLLATIKSSSQPTLDTFSTLLDTHRLSFLPCRSARSLHAHWLLLRQYHLLPDQTVQPMPRGDHVLNFSDAEDLVDDRALLAAGPGRDEAAERELAVADRRQKREIRRLEAELPRWAVLVDSVTGVSPPEFDSLTLAVIRGRLVRYLMRSRQITLGRATKTNQIDVDLSLEGPAWKVSRRQGLVRLDPATGEFSILNEGKRPMYIDGRPVLRGGRATLANNCVIEMSCLRFIFLINLDLIGAIRQETVSGRGVVAGAGASAAAGK